MTLGKNQGKLNQSFDKGRRAETEALIVAMWSALSRFVPFVVGSHNTVWSNFHRQNQKWLFPSLGINGQTWFVKYVKRERHYGANVADKRIGASFRQLNLANLPKAYCQASHASLSSLPLSCHVSPLWLSEPQNNDKEICTESHILRNRLYSPQIEITAL